MNTAQVKRYMPYAAGSRGCVGRPQAQVTMLATLAALLSRFSFRLAEKVGQDPLSWGGPYAMTL